MDAVINHQNHQLTCGQRLSDQQESYLQEVLRDASVKKYTANGKLDKQYIVDHLYLFCIKPEPPSLQKIDALSSIRNSDIQKMIDSDKLPAAIALQVCWIGRMALSCPSIQKLIADDKLNIFTAISLTYVQLLAFDTVSITKSIYAGKRTIQEVLLLTFDEVTHIRRTEK